MITTSPWDFTPVASQLGPQGRDDKATMKKAAAGFEAVLKMPEQVQERRA